MPLLEEPTPKLSQVMRVAITLRPKVTKDRLLQGEFIDELTTNQGAGCMRMPRLGEGQSVDVALREVDRIVLGLIPRRRASGNRIRVLDIVR
jgi:hypothetical protein